MFNRSEIENIIVIAIIAFVGGFLISPNFISYLGSNTKDYLEIILQIALSLIAIFALNRSTQAVKLTKQQIQENKIELDKRYEEEIIDNTAILIEKFREILEKFYELNNTVPVLLGQKQISNIKSYSLKEFVIEEIESDNELIGMYHLAHYGLAEVKDDIGKMANKLEVIALSFVHGKTKKEIAMPVIADTYCRMIEQLFFFYCSFRKRDAFNLYSNTIKLYLEWSNELKKLNVGFDKKYDWSAQLAIQGKRFGA